MLTFLSLCILLPHAIMAAPALAGPQQAALQEEVNVLVYGVIQFSTALHELYNSTAQKLDRIRHRTDIYEQSLRTLHHQAQSAQQKQQEIRRILEGLQFHLSPLPKATIPDCVTTTLALPSLATISVFPQKAEDMMLRKEDQRNKEVLQGVHVGHQKLVQRLKALEERLLCMEERSFQNQEPEVAALKMKSHTGVKLNLEKSTVAKFTSRR
ncbi:hypothetical protein JD844_009977 [Phrynosoma platyrhinos]|uniref:Uncharacterized protein n=1 Tax=Phrynosoma platyrhinos TaxID=52577 RepID=A0ABQ7TG58_PHRPL|nr:hypothetical protein JD844_009977 [Phrynosoma platyrhinos]